MRRGKLAKLLWDDVDESKRLMLLRDGKDLRRKAGNDQCVLRLGDAWELLQRQHWAHGLATPTAVHQRNTGGFASAPI